MINQIKKDQLKARKNKNTLEVGVLTALLSEIVAVGKNKGNRETTNEEAIQVVKKFKNGVQMNIDLTKDEVKLNQLKDEIQIYDRYIPQQMDENELRLRIKLAIDKGHNTIASIMSHLKENFNGLYDGKQASAIIKELL